MPDTFNLEEIITPEPLRANIYKQVLEDTYNTFRGSSSQFDRRFETALRDRTLLNTLADMLDRYVICGVAADLSRCRTALYDPQLVLAPPASAVNIDPYVAPTLPGSFPSNADENRKKDDTIAAYKRYFDWFILPDVLQQKELMVSGIGAFWLRYPMITLAVSTTAEHFRSNIQAACRHVQADWDLIANFFFPNNPPTRLVKITSTGSDFHKGGKQVLLLTFKMQDNSEKKLVYKPADVEMDYRLLGTTEPVLTNDTLKGQLGDLKSVSEVLNTLLDDEYKLPTYRILPCNPGSGLIAQNGVLPIDTSYGYIEFLTNEPEADPTNEALSNWQPNQVSDWVTSNPDDVVRFYRQCGRLLAMASLFSMSDIHVENLIVHKLQPHVIDAEISFTGPMPDVTGTLMLDSSAQGALVATEIPAHMRRLLRPGVDGTANLAVFEEEAQVKSTRPGRNRIYLAQGEKAPEQARPQAYVEHICRGFLEMITAMKDKPVQLTAWLKDPQIKKLVGRFTPERTSFFQQQLRQLYSPKYCSMPVPKSDPGYERSPFTDWRQAAQKNWNKPSNRWPSPRPNYALHTPANDFADYLNCDVPAYYHQLGSTDLMNSRGQIVTISPAPQDSTIDRSTYFLQDTLSIIQGQLASLQLPDMFSQRVSKSIEVLVNRLGVTSDAVNQLLQEFQPQPV